MTGLSTREVQDRVERGLSNREVETSTKTVKEIIKENVFTYFNLIFVVLAILLVIVGSFRDLSFMLDLKIIGMTVKEVFFHSETAAADTNEAEGNFAEIRMRRLESEKGDLPKG